MTNQVSYHRISQDDQKEGGFVNCENCERELVNYAKIDGTIFGMNCAATIMGTTKSRMTADHDMVVRQERAQAQRKRIAERRANK